MAEFSLLLNPGDSFPSIIRRSILTGNSYSAVSRRKQRLGIQ